MDQFRVIEIKKSVYNSNDKEAEKLRSQLKSKKVFMLNLMSSPGSGKTTTVLRTIERLQKDVQIGVMEADIDSDVDAQTVSESGTRVIQLHSGGLCHLDAGMVGQGLEAFGTDNMDLVILENIGNLICPAEFDTGAAKNVMILSVPEGDDKPLKYPVMFEKVDVLIINKIDTVGIFDFDIEAVQQRVSEMNPRIKVFPLSAKTGEGVTEWTNWLLSEIRQWQQ